VLILTQWKNTPQVSCKACGVKSQLGNAGFSLLLGWWGFPWGLIITPVQIVRNIVGMFRGASANGPSASLERTVGLALAAEVARRVRVLTKCRRFESMFQDPVVKEVDETRERLLAEYGGMDALLREFRAIEDEMRHRVVRLDPRPPNRTTRKG
jgi:hypothetical protein